MLLSRIILIFHQIVNEIVRELLKRFKIIQLKLAFAVSDANFEANKTTENVK